MGYIRFELDHIANTMCITTSEPNNSNINFSLTLLVKGYKIPGRNSGNMFIVFLGFTVFLQFGFCVAYCPFLVVFSLKLFSASSKDLVQ